jgi:hypothetical protein
LAFHVPYRCRHLHAWCRRANSAALLPRLITDFSPHLDQRSAGLLLNLSSNNPFRNRAASPLASPALVSPFDDPPPRPLSRNPFLDPAVAGRSSFSDIRSASDTMSSEKRPSLTAEDIFVRSSFDRDPDHRRSVFFKVFETKLIVLRPGLLDTRGLKVQTSCPAAATGRWETTSTPNESPWSATSHARRCAAARSEGPAAEPPPDPITGRGSPRQKDARERQQNRPSESDSFPSAASR